MATSYITGYADLLVGDLGLGSKTDVSVYIDAGAAELEACLAGCYETPLPVAAALSEGDASVLKNAHQYFSTGLLLIGLEGSHGEDLSETGRWYMAQAREKLAAYCGPNSYLTFESISTRSSTPTTGPGATAGAMAPTVVNRDSESAVTAFTQFNRGRCTPWTADGNIDFTS